jgi:hypothetical protein
MPRSSTWSLSLKISNQRFVRISHLPIRATCPAYLVVLDLIDLIILGEKSRPKNYEAPHYAVFCSLQLLYRFTSRCLLSILFSNTLNLCYCLNLKNSVPYLYKITEWNSNRRFQSSTDSKSYALQSERLILLSLSLFWLCWLWSLLMMIIITFATSYTSTYRGKYPDCDRLNKLLAIFFHCYCCLLCIIICLQVYRSTYINHVKPDAHLNHILLNLLVPTAKRTQRVSMTTIRCLILFRETIAVYSENHMRPINALWAKHRVTEC